MSRSGWLGAALVFAAVCVLGCGGGTGEGPATVPVTGTVTLDGTPVEGATVSFSPEDKANRAATGLTDSDGRFELGTIQPGDGAMPGSYKVAISKTSGAAAGPPASQEEAMKRAQEQMASGGLGRRPAPVKDELPAIYKNAQTSKLTATVTQDGDNEFEFKLSRRP